MTADGPTYEAGHPEAYSVSDGRRILWTHRRGVDWDLYFLAHPGIVPAEFTVSFPITGREPEAWYPDRGEVEKLTGWHEEAGRTVVPLSLVPVESLCVVFAAPTGRKVRSTTRRAPKSFELYHPWKARFTERLSSPIELTLDSLMSWSDRPEEDIKYYSGTAIYTTGFQMPPEMLRKDRQVFINLGTVRELVEVRLNGKVVSTLWKPPFTTEITQSVRAGENQLELAVTNTWRNRIIGDYGKPEAQRKAFVVPRLRKGREWLPGGPGTVLSPAGLLGPVSVTCWEVD
jgi:hypothetical protein